MNWADWTLLAVIALSSLLGVKRGFVREALSLLGWGLAFFVAMTFHPVLAAEFTDTVESISLRFLLAFALLFVGTLLAASLLSYFIVTLVRVTGLGGTDRLLGALFGFARGLIVIMLIVIFLPQLMPVDQESWWQGSVLIPHFLSMEDWCRDTFAQLLEWGRELLDSVPA